MRKNRLYLAFSALMAAALILGACAQATPTEAPPVVTEAPPPPPPPPTEVPVMLGSAELPIVMALAPSATTQELMAGGDAIAAKLSELTGYTITTTIPTSYAALVEAMGSGNAHIGWLPPLAYVLASQKGYASVAYVAIRSGSDYYGAQFLAHADSGLTSYFDPAANEGKGANTADAATALAQFDGKKPCWTDPLSASGYVIPSGIVASAGAKVKAAAFVIGHPTVVRALYSTGICDFGATYIDARTSSSLKDLADVSDKVVVIWRTDPIIPNDNVSIAAGVPADVSAKILEALGALAGSEEGITLLKNGGYDISGLSPRDDTFYDQFRVYLEASGIDVTTLVK